jgi:Prokaryotic phospholipase A2
MRSGRLARLVLATLLCLLACATPALASSAAERRTAHALAPTVAEAQQAETACGPGGAGDQLVPDSGPWFNFTAACANHDACYGAHLGQANCDVRFRSDMYAHCATRVWYQRGLCYATANTYYEAVRRFGYLFY